jgi:predicted O-methyltransferase YrrM
MTSLALTARRAARLASGVARHRALYPALYLRPTTQRTPVEALAELGFDRVQLDAYNREYEELAGPLFARMRERAVEVGSEQHVWKLADPGRFAHESKRLGYLAVRAVRPRVVFETGTFTGVLTAFLLRALEENGGGHVTSFDLPAREPMAGAPEIHLPAGEDPGWAIPEELRGRLTLVSGDTRETLPPALAAAGTVDVFIHDSLHTTRHMLFEFGEAWPRLTPGGVLISDDAFDNAAYWWFTKRRRLPFLHIGNMAVTRKPT